MRRPLVPFGAFLIGFSALSLFGAAISWQFTVRTGASLWTLQPDSSANLPYVIAMNFVYWLTWAPLGPLALALAARWRIDAHTWRWTVPLHIAAAFAVACIHIVVVGTGRTLMQRSVGMDVSWSERVVEMFFRTIDTEMMVYLALVVLHHAVEYYGAVRERDVRAAQLETKLVEAQLQALQRQLHPHFLFNTLHAISALVHSDPDKAEDMIERLSDLLRITLDKVGVQEVTLREELEYVRAYLDIEQVHFGERLEIEYRIDPATLDAHVPNMILQPLAENAIRHGLEPRARKGRLTIESQLAGDRLTLRVIDTGRGMTSHSITQANQGVGLGNTRARLQHLYRDDASIAFAPSPGGGVIVNINLPFRELGQKAPAPAPARSTKHLAPGTWHSAPE